jgi:hypothetical protein
MDDISLPTAMAEYNHLRDRHIPYDVCVELVGRMSSVKCGGLFKWYLIACLETNEFSCTYICVHVDTTKV